MDKVEKCCKTCYSYDMLMNACEHEFTEQKIFVGGHVVPIMFHPPEPDEFCCSLWR